MGKQVRRLTQLETYNVVQFLEKNRADIDGKSAETIAKIIKQKVGVDPRPQRIVTINKEFKLGLKLNSGVVNPVATLYHRLDEMNTRVAQLELALNRLCAEFGLSPADVLEPATEETTDNAHTHVPTPVNPATPAASVRFNPVLARRENGTHKS